MPIYQLEIQQAHRTASEAALNKFSLTMPPSVGAHRQDPQGPLPADIHWHSPASMDAASDNQEYSLQQDYHSQLGKK